MLFLESMTPADDDDLFILDESEGEGDSEETGSEEEQARRPKSAKRRIPILRTPSSETGEVYDEDEAALQQAIAMSMEGDSLCDLRSIGCLVELLYLCNSFRY